MIKAIIFDCYGVLSSLDSGKPNQAFFDYIRDQLKPIYKIGILSNVSGNILSQLFTKQQLDLIDEAVLSYQIGAVKPDPDAYEAAAAHLGVSPHECIFIDDIEGYATASEAVGMKCIYHTNTQETINKIKDLIHA